MAQNPRTGVVRRFFGGMAYLGRGLRLWVTSPGIMVLGAIPALVVGAVYVTGIVLLAINLDAIVAWMTPFDGGWVPLVRTIVGVALITAGVLLAAVSYGAVTLAVGDPFYERISRRVDQRLGGAPAEVTESFWKGAGRSLVDGTRLLLVTASVGLALFAAGFIPVAGPIVVPVVGALVGGWLLTIELCGFAFEARGLRLRDRRRMLGARRATTLGFGVVTYVLFLVPLAAVVIMPAAVAGATMLSRDAIAGRTAG